MVHQVLQRFGFRYSLPQSTPLPTGHSLSAPPSDESVEPSGPYPELVGCLMVLRYLCSTSGMGLVLGGRGPVVLTGHADASWVDDLAIQRPSQGYTFSLGSGSVSLRSTRSSFVLSSSCEAEMYAGAMAAQELRWLTYLLTDFRERPRSSPVLYVDNKAMIALCQEHRLEHRTKHIALRYFLARELQQRGQLRLAYVATRANTADIFTKALQSGNETRALNGAPSTPSLSLTASSKQPAAAGELARRAAPFCRSVAVCLLTLIAWSLLTTLFSRRSSHSQEPVEVACGRGSSRQGGLHFQWKGELTAVTLPEGLLLAIFQIDSNDCIDESIAERQISFAKCGFVSPGETSSWSNATTFETSQNVTLITSWSNTTFVYFEGQAIHAICSRANGTDGSAEPSVTTPSLLRIYYDTHSVDLLARKLHQASWNRLVYAAAAEPEGLYVWAKGITNLQNRSHGQVKCMVDGAETSPLILSQEIALCPIPQPNSIRSACGCLNTPVTLSARGSPLPSVASVCRLNSSLDFVILVSGEPPQAANHSEGTTATAASQSGRSVLRNGYSHTSRVPSIGDPPMKQYYLCACTMVLDSAKFMGEWLLYHAFLGVEHFFVYDNGSEDGLWKSIKEAQETGRARGFEVSATIRSWPWLKSQEGGFSHCALQAKKLCTWAMFFDVDEFVFPARMVKEIESRSLFAAGSQYAFLLNKFVKGMVKGHSAAKKAAGRNESCQQLGQIALPGLLFGPSGHQEHPEKGVVSGYTCRLKLPDRHKSIILTEGIAPPLHNVIHHFTILEHQYCTAHVGNKRAAIFHYKYQAWPEFKTKFRRRASTFVPDWMQMDRMQSKDRVPDLGVEAVEPADWKDRYCEEKDPRLKRISAQIFSATSRWRFANAFNVVRHTFEKLFFSCGGLV
ncbi:unnamed protein product [Closterium sp. NIES-54]